MSVFFEGVEGDRQRLWVLDLATGKERTRLLDTGAGSVQQVVCGDQGATLVGADGASVFTMAVTDDGKLGDRQAGPDIGEDSFSGMSNRRVMLFEHPVRADRAG